MTQNELQTLMTRSLLDVFNQRDPQQRAAAIDEVYSPDIVFYEEQSNVMGAAAMLERAQDLLDGAPGFVFAPVGQPAINHDLGRQPWTFGPPDGPPVVFGTDIAGIAATASRRCTCLSNRRPPDTHTIPNGYWWRRPATPSNGQELDHDDQTEAGSPDRHTGRASAAPARAPVGEDAESILQQVREKSGVELDAMRLEMVRLRAR
jgi:hypothetical protein